MGLAVESSKNDEGERDRWECKEGFREMTRAFFRPITRITVEAQTLGIVRWNGLAGVGLSSSSLIFEFTPFSANPVVTRFDVRGLKLDEISATCNWAKYDEAARQRAQQAKLGVLRLDTPLEIEGGISIPVPYGATPRIQGDPPQHITIFQVARVSDLKQFFEAGLSIYGWKPSADGCWLNKDQHLPAFQ